MQKICGVHFFYFRLEKPFWGKSGQKNQNCQFKQKIVAKTNLNMGNSMLMITFSVFDWKYLFGQVWSKNQNCQFKVKTGTQTNLNMMNSIVKFFFFLFSTESILFLEICSKNQDCLLKLKFRIQINLNMQNWKVIFIFFSSEMPFLCQFDPKIQKSQFKTKFYTQSNLQNLKNFIVMLTFSILKPFCKSCPKINFILMLPN